jgi:hypothetical protein
MSVRQNLTIPDADYPPSYLITFIRTPQGLGKYKPTLTEALCVEQTKNAGRVQISEA